MPEHTLNAEQIRSKLNDFCDNIGQCGLDAFVVKKSSPKLKSISFSEECNSEGKNFRTILKEMFIDILREMYIAPDAEYADGSQLADNQNKFLIFKQEDRFQPFGYLHNVAELGDFSADDLLDASGMLFRIRKGHEDIWLYQHLWSIMIPNKKKTHKMARFMRFEDQIVFEEQTESLLTIAHKIDILIMDNFLITGNVALLQKHFGFQDYIYQAAEQAVQCISQKSLVTNNEKLTEYISRGKPKYAKKMMRIGHSKVLSLTGEQLIQKIKALDRWKGKFNIDDNANQITLNTYSHVESLIDLFDERYTRSDVTDTEYDTDVKTVAPPTEQ